MGKNTSVARGNKLRHARDMNRAKSDAARVERKNKRDDRGEKLTPRNMDHDNKKIGEAESDEELREYLRTDELQEIMQGERETKIMLTTCDSPCNRMIRFINEVDLLFPNSHYYPRSDYPLSWIVKYAAIFGFSTVMSFTQRAGGEIYGVYVCHLPEGPTAFYRMTNVKLIKEMQRDQREALPPMTTHDPEVILAKFTTPIARRSERVLRSLFPKQPEYESRRLIVFHNHRDFIFFRHHRYEFRGEDGENPKVQLKEIGPRWTMKMRWMHKGLFDVKNAQFEFLWRPELQVKHNVFYM